MLLRALKIAHKQRKLCGVLRQYSKAKGEITTSKKKKRSCKVSFSVYNIVGG